MRRQYETREGGGSELCVAGSEQFERGAPNQCDSCFGSRGGFGCDQGSRRREQHFTLRPIGQESLIVFLAGYVRRASGNGECAKLSTTLDRLEEEERLMTDRVGGDLVAVLRDEEFLGAGFALEDLENLYFDELTLAMPVGRDEEGLRIEDSHVSDQIRFDHSQMEALRSHDHMSGGVSRCDRGSGDDAHDCDREPHPRSHECREASELE